MYGTLFLLPLRNSDSGIDLLEVIESGLEFNMSNFERLELFAPAMDAFCSRLQTCPLLPHHFAHNN